LQPRPLLILHVLSVDGRRDPVGIRWATRE
jgi:hypothetical protein